MYDVFKLTVVLILLILLIILLLNPPKNSSIPISVAQAATQTPIPPSTATATASLIPPTNTITPSPVPQATSTPLPSATMAPTFTPTIVPETPTLAPTMTPASETATTTPLPVQANPTGDCSVAIVSRLAVGMDAKVASNLNLRSSPDMQNNLVRTHPTGTLLTVTNGPVCTPYGGKAYLWWEVRAADGVTGWSAEGSLEGKIYFLVPEK